MQQIAAYNQTLSLPFAYILLGSLGLILMLTPEAAAEPQIQQDDMGQVSVTAQQYSALITPAGMLKDVMVGGLPTISGGFPVAENGALPSVNVTGNLVAIRRGEQRVEYTFFDKHIKVETEGYAYALEYALGSCKSVVAEGGKGGPVKQNVAYSRTSAIVLTNGKTISYTNPFHFTRPSNGRLVYSNYLNHAVKRGALLEFEIQLGMSALAVDMLSGLAIGAPTSAYGPLHEDGNLGEGMCHFPDPANIMFESFQTNASEQTLTDLTYRLTVLDHYLDGKMVVNQQQTAELSPGQQLKLTWRVAELEPGFYYASIACLRHGELLTETRQNFAVNLSEYRPALTRPDDFAAFWAQQLKDLRAIPFAETSARNAEKSSDAFTIYDVTINGADGQLIAFELSVPTAPGPHMFVGNSKEPQRHVRMNFAEGRYYPEEATYRRWDARDDNNLLQVILFFRRLTDYLVQRDDVSQIYLTGASRTGPIQFINAALDPEKIAGVDIFVPCPVGMSWEQPRYRGWGGKPSNLSWKAYLDMAAYVDAANHAPDMKVPFAIMYGVQDDLAPPQGIEALFKHATQAPWKRISRDGVGHQRTKGQIALSQQLKQKLGVAGTAEHDDDILTDH